MCIIGMIPVMLNARIIQNSVTMIGAKRRPLAPITSSMMLTWTRSMAISPRFCSFPGTRVGFFNASTKNSASTPVMNRPIRLIRVGDHQKSPSCGGKNSMIVGAL